MGIRTNTRSLVIRQGDPPRRTGALEAPISVSADVAAACCALTAFINVCGSEELALMMQKMRKYVIMYDCIHVATVLTYGNNAIAYTKEESCPCIQHTTS